MKKTKPLSHAEIAAFCRQSAMILKAGITPAEGMEILKQDTVSKEGQALFDQIGLSCRKGNPFHQALSETGLFPTYVVNLTALGEESGNTDEVLLSLAEYYEREEAVSESIKSAVAYPLVMIAMMFVVILVLIVKVLPIFRQVFRQLGTEMSPLASSLLSIGNAFSRYSVVFLLLLFLIVIGAICLLRSSSGRARVLHFLSRFPLTAEFFAKMAAGRFASGMYLAFTSGMDTFRSLDMIADIVENDAMRSKIEHCRKSLEENADLPEALADAGIFSRLYSRMITVGFRSGSVDLVMKQISRQYDEEIEKQLNHLIGIIEPTLVILLSLIVGMILMSVLLPLMGIMSSIG